MAETKAELPGWIAEHLRRYQASNYGDGEKIVRDIWNLGQDEIEN